MIKTIENAPGNVLNALGQSVLLIDLAADVYNKVDFAIEGLLASDNKQKDIVNARILAYDSQRENFL